MAQGNLGNAFLALGARERGIARLEQAAAAFQEALKELEGHRDNPVFAKARAGLEQVEFELRQRGTNPH